MKIVGLAGGIGSGKSTTAAYLRYLGIPVFDASRAAKSVTAAKGSSSLQKIADIILNESIDNNFGKIKDDMSVIVGKVIKKIN